MKFDSVQELIDKIYENIKNRNTHIGDFSIPHADTFYEELISQYNLIPFTVPKLLKILNNSHLIFTFNVVEKDMKKKLTAIDAYVVSDLGTIILLKDYFEKRFVEEFTVQFNKKTDSMIALKDFIPRIQEFNNTALGIAALKLINLIHFETRLQKEVSNFSKKKKAELLEAELQNCDPITFFISDTGKRQEVKRAEPARSEAQKTESQKARITDNESYSDFLFNSKSQPIKKTLSVYGIEFYCRVCFREYQFHLITELINDKIIMKAGEFLTLKKLLKKVRSHADQDQKLQEFAVEINTLERLINEKLKELGE